MIIQGGVETITITDAPAGELLDVHAADGTKVVGVRVDEAGNAHIAFIPPAYSVIESLEDLVAAVAGGMVIAPGVYQVVSPSAGTHTVQVLSVSDHPCVEFYEQELATGFGYLTVRDGVKLSVMVRFPNEDLYGPAPWPTVIEYSGYGPSHPEEPQPGTMLANLLGFAVVGVNMRGTGCSGGVFDVLSPAQAADGYDVIEIVARQPWVLHGRPGMVGLSYPGISQLFVAATQPPSLAAITPLSVIDDLWRQQWPGGIYNSGFTRMWLAQRDAETQIGGMAWDQQRIDNGDEVCAENQRIRSLNMDFEQFGRAAASFTSAMSARRIADSVDQIQVPVYLTGAWQDEQTGARFAGMLDQFHSSPHTIFTLFNGHHPDGYSPMLIARWFEFLSFYVARRVPSVHPLIRQFAPLQFAEHFGYTQEVEADRFGDLMDDFEAALARYQGESPIRVLYESGAAGDVAGAPGHRFERVMEQFPPAGAKARRWWLAQPGRLVDQAPTQAGEDLYQDDVEAGAHSYALTNEFNDFIQPTVPIDWSYFDDHKCLSYEVQLTEALHIVGHGNLDLWLRPATTDTSVQITLSEIRPDGLETRVQCGWHRLSHRIEDAARSDELHVEYTFEQGDTAALEVGQWHHCRVPLMPVAHVFRPGSKLRITLSTPGRDMPFWCFENPVQPGAEHGVGIGGQHACSLVMSVLDDLNDHPEQYPAPDSLRGQPMREARAISNRSVAHVPS